MATSIEEHYKRVRKLFRGKAVLAATAISRIETKYRGPAHIISRQDILAILSMAITKGDIELISYLDQKDQTTPHLYFQFKE